MGDQNLFAYSSESSWLSSSVLNRDGDLKWNEICNLHDFLDR